VPLDPMSDDSEARWSPADNPYAIAVSKSQWALWAAQLFASDAKETAATSSRRSTPGRSSASYVHCNAVPR
jgi:hypothetical protein